MKKIIFFLIVFVPFNLFSQQNNKIGMGLFLGEGTGLLTDIDFSKSWSVEWSISRNELFYDYYYEQRYTRSRGVTYKDMYGMSVLFRYHLLINDRLNCRLALGPQMRMLTAFNSGVPISLPPGAFPITDPEEKMEIDWDVLSLVGLKYRLGEKFAVFCDAGAFFNNFQAPEVWVKGQFRVGFLCQLSRK